MKFTTEVRERSTLAETAGGIFSSFSAVFLCVIFFAFPLFYHDYYFDILTSKYRFYWIAALLFVAVCLLVGLVLLFVDLKEFSGKNAKRFFSGWKLSNLKKLPLAYKAVAVFWLFAALSTLFSDYRYESFWGNEGRFSGLFLITLYVLTTVLIGMTGRPKQWYLDLFLLSSVLVCLFGITDYFQMDLLGWKANVETKHALVFTSTMGNINTYTAYVGMVVAIASGLLMKERNVFRGIWYFIVVLIGFFALITGQSDNAYLSLGALFVMLPFFLFIRREGVVRYGVLAASFMTVIKVIDEVNKVMADRVIGLSGLFNILTRYEHLEVIVAALWAVVAALYIWDRMLRARGRDGELGKPLCIAWGFLVGAAAVVVLYVLYDANFGDSPEKYASVAQYVVFDDNWGTNRGYCWRIGWESYMELPVLHRLFGFGPDTYGILTWGFREEAIELYGVFYESAHNEYLQYLVTMGPFAVIAYVLFLVGCCVKMAKGIAAAPWLLAPLLAVFCYAAQAVVNINLPIATPIMWAFLAVGMAGSRRMAENPDNI